MSERARLILLLSEKTWAELTPEEQSLFDDWCVRAQGVDLYMMLRHARRVWRRTSSSTQIPAVRGVPDDET